MKTYQINTKYSHESVWAQVRRYHDGNIRIDFVGNEGPVFVATVNVPGIEDLGEHVVAIKDYSENEGVRAELVRLGIINPIPLAYAHSGFVEIPIHRLSDQFIIEHDL